MASIGDNAVAAGTQCATPGSATLSWVPPTENTDGSVLTDLAGYKVYYGTEVGNYTSTITLSDPALTTHIVGNLPEGFTYYFVITAFTTSSIESEHSNMGSKVMGDVTAIVLPCSPMNLFVGGVNTDPVTQQ